MLMMIILIGRLRSPAREAELERGRDAARVAQAAVEAYARSHRMDF